MEKPGASPGSNACAGFSGADRALIERAASRYVASHGLLTRALNRVGRTASGAVERTINLFLPNSRRAVEEYASEALWSLLGASRFGLASRHEGPADERFYRGAVATSGALSGIVGGVASLADIPFTMTLMFRAIAEIARSHGEDLDDFETRRACLEVFGFGTIHNEAEDIEVSYWTVRGALTHAPLSLFLRTVAARFSVVISDQAMAAMVPLAGAVVGASVNYLFMGYFQAMAQVHFTLRALERRYDPAQVRACFDNQVAAYQQRKQLFRSTA
ncbi:MAG: EcsC family protein [Gammaproteobacteria bacterium]